MRQGELTTATVFISIMLFVGLVWYFADRIGANFEVTLDAVVYSALFLGVAGGILYFLRLKKDLLAAVTAAVLWPGWWKVLDSIANNGVNPDKLSFRFPAEPPWWNTSIFLYGTEAVLIVLTIMLMASNWDDGLTE